jgi:heme exporter protein D
MTKNGSAFKAGQYYAVRCNGNNGDLIVGRVVSVLAIGHVVLHNLLSNKTSTKKEHVLRQRNKRISKAQALGLQEIYRRTGSKAKTRERAVKMAPYGSLPPEKRLADLEGRAKDIHMRTAEKILAVRAARQKQGLKYALVARSLTFIEDILELIFGTKASSPPEE